MERGAVRHLQNAGNGSGLGRFRTAGGFFLQQKEKSSAASSRPEPGKHAIITYFEKGLSVAGMLSEPGEIVMNPQSCLEYVKLAGLVVPCDETVQFTLEGLQNMIIAVRNVRNR